MFFPTCSFLTNLPSSFIIFLICYCLSHQPHPSHSSFVVSFVTPPSHIQPYLLSHPTSLFYFLSFTSLSHFASDSSPSYIASPPIFDLLNHPTYLFQFHLTTPFPISFLHPFFSFSSPTPPLSSYFTLFILPLPHHVCFLCSLLYSLPPSHISLFPHPTFLNKNNYQLIPHCSSALVS